MVLLGAACPFGHDFGAELVESLAGEAHQFDDLRPSDCMTKEVDFHGERTELEFAGAVLEDFFPTDTLSTDRSDCGKGYLVGSACGDVSFFHDRFTASFSPDEFCERVFFPGVPRYEFGPDSCAQIAIRKNVGAVVSVDVHQVDVAGTPWGVGAACL